MTAAGSAGEAVTPGQAGAELIAAERLRQVSQEGYTPEHDREHVDHELARAAAMYTLHAIGCKQAASPGYWPWPDWEVKPDAPVRMLVKAGALIAAEIDRLQGTAQAAIAAQPPQPAPELAAAMRETAEVRDGYAKLCEEFSDSPQSGQSARISLTVLNRHRVRAGLEALKPGRTGLT